MSNFNVNVDGRTDARTDELTDERTDIWTPISHPAISRCDKNPVFEACRPVPIQTKRRTQTEV